MTARDYTHDDWIPWYVRDSASWLELSLAARGAAEGIARKMGRDREELHLGSRGLHGLTRLLGCTWEELEPALNELFRIGPNGEPPRLVHDRETNSLRDPDAGKRRRPTSTKRVQGLRAKREEAERDVTRETVSSVTSVSERCETVTPVPSLLISSDLISDSKIPEEITSAREEPADQDAQPDWWDGVIETIASRGERIEDPGLAWLRYSGHRAGKRLPATRKDALYWLPTVVVKEQRAARTEAARTRERDAKFDAERAAKKSGAAAFTEPQKLTPDKIRELAEQFPMRRTKREVA